MISAGKPYRRTSDNLWVVPINMPIRGDGKRVRKTVARKNRNQAIKAAALRVIELREGAVNGDPAMTVAQWLDYWIHNVVTSRGLRPNTIRSYGKMINNQIVPVLGAYRLNTVGPSQIREMHAAHAERKLSIKTAQLAHVVLQMALEDAVKDEVLVRNSAKLVGKPKGETVSRGALTLDQANQLIRTAIEAEDPMATRWATALITGARQGELLGLEWSRVDFDNNEIDLSWALTSIGQVHGCLALKTGDPSCGAPINRPARCPERRPDIPRGYRCKHLRGPIVLAPPKTESSKRIVTMIGPIRDALQFQRDHAPANDYGLVWANPRTGAPINPVTDHANWKKALGRADLPPMPLHSARHTAATLMQEMGVDEATRMEIMGHNSEAMAQKYAHGRNSRATGQAISNLGDKIAGSSFRNWGGVELPDDVPVALPA